MFNGVPNDSIFLNRRLYDEQIETGLCKRDEFQRDRDRIMHSRAFRRMMHKTQIFNANKGDHYRNRLTHTLEVSQIARSIGKVLKLNNELIEAIALGHDVGHTPFGHIGERTLNNMLTNLSTPYGFKHNFQSLRVVDSLESRCNSYNGLNLSLAVREGILKHTSLKNKGKLFSYPETNFSDIDLELPSFTFEGQVVALADEIAQCTHDLEDGVRSKIITVDSIMNDPFIRDVIEKHNITFNPSTKTPTYDTRSLIINNLIGFFIEDACKNSLELINTYKNNYKPTYSSQNQCIQIKCVSLSSEIEKHRNRIYNELIINKVIYSEQISISDAKSEYIIKRLFSAYKAHPKQLPDYVLERYFKQKNMIFDRTTINDEAISSDPYFIRTICDHISGMTDQFASREYIRLYVPEYI